MVLMQHVLAQQDTTEIIM